MPRLFSLWFRFKYYVYCAVFAAGVLSFNLLIPSLLNFYFWTDQLGRWQSYIGHIIHLHRDVVGPFIRRPITTYFIDLFSQIFSVRLWLSFIFVQFLFLTIAAEHMGRVAQTIGGLRARLPAIACFFFSFTILFSFVTPNDSYDEAAQYIFLFLAIRTLVERKAAYFMALFFLALVARESSVIALPGLVLLDRALALRHSRIDIIKFVLPVACYAGYFLLLGSEGDPNRFLYWQKNFASIKIAFETLVSLILALGLPVLILAAAKRLQLVDRTNPWLRSFTITALVNTPIVMLTTYARESRLFALPLIFLWPLCGDLLARIFEKLKSREARIYVDVKSLVPLTMAIVTASVYRPEYRHVLGYQICAVIYFALAGLKVRRSQFGNGVPRSSRVKT